MEIPFEQLDPKILRAVIVEFVTCEGTDYVTRFIPSMKKWQLSNLSWRKKGLKSYSIKKARPAMWLRLRS